MGELLLAAFVALVSCPLAAVGLDEVCNSQLWQCDDQGTALLRLQALKSVTSAFGIKPELAVRFGGQVKKVVIGSNDELTVSKIVGPNVDTIDLSGQRKSIKSVCLFQDPEALPMLQTVRIHDSEIEAFQLDQICHHQQPSSGPRLTISVQNTFIEVDKDSGNESAPLQFGSSSSSKVLKSLAFSNVTFVGTSGLNWTMSAEDNSASPISAERVKFVSRRNCRRNSDDRLECSHPNPEMPPKSNFQSNDSPALMKAAISGCILILAIHIVI